MNVYRQIVFTYFCIGATVMMFWGFFCGFKMTEEVRQQGERVHQARAHPATEKEIESSAKVRLHCGIRYESLLIFQPFKQVLSNHQALLNYKSSQQLQQQSNPMRTPCPKAIRDNVCTQMPSLKDSLGPVGDQMEVIMQDILTRLFFIFQRTIFCLECLRQAAQNTQDLFSCEFLMLLLVSCVCEVPYFKTLQ